MMRLAKRYFIWVLVCVIALSMAVLPQFAPKAVANNEVVLEQSLSLITYNPPNRGAPGRTADGGSRRCSEAIAVQPSETRWGETTKTHPTFWLYVAGAADSVKLTLADEYSKEQIYQTTFTPTVRSGIGRYTLPFTAPSLAVDTAYRWTMSLTCPSADGESVVTGVIVRRAMSEGVKAEFDDATPRDRVVLLAADGLWYDALNELAELRLANSSNAILANDWTRLLQYAKPEDVETDILKQPLMGLYPEVM